MDRGRAGFGFRIPPARLVILSSVVTIATGELSPRPALVLTLADPRNVEHKHHGEARSGYPMQARRPHEGDTLETWRTNHEGLTTLS